MNDRSNNNRFIKNIITTNSGYGFLIYDSTDDNLFYHNAIINNTEQASDECNNQWDNGYPSGGNYWSDYTGTDMFSEPNQDEPGSDWIGDTPYVIDADSQDNYPLTSPWGYPQPMLNISSLSWLR